MHDIDARRQNYQIRVTDGLIQSIIDSSSIGAEAEDGSSYILTAEVIEALLTVLAAVVEGEPGTTSRRDIRKASDEIARRLNRRINDMRDLYDATGTRLFPTLPIDRH